MNNNNKLHRSRKYIVQIIEWYQKYISPDHSVWAKDTLPYCRYTPSCSNYMKEAVEKKGVVLGMTKGIWRILRCMPWSKGGYDPVDKK